MATRGKLDCGIGGDGVLGGDQMALEEAEATKAVCIYDCLYIL